MIIYGTRHFTKTMETGAFYCPHCCAERSYNEKRVKKYFTVYFIPMIPLSSPSKYVECHNCENTYTLEVLSRQQRENEHFETELEKAVRRSLVMIMLADGKIDDNECELVQALANGYSRNEVTAETIRIEVELCEMNPQPIESFMKSVAPMLNGHGKEGLIRAALAVAAADGNIDEAELELVMRMAASLGMTKAHFVGIIAETDSN